MSIGSAAESRSLKQRAIAALKWNYLGTMVRTSCGLLIGIVLARVLGPTPFGEIAIAGLVIGLGNLMADFGFGAALIQPKEISDEEIRFAFSVQVILGALLSFGGFCTSGLIAQAFHQPHVAPVLRVLMLTFVLQSIGLTASSLLARQLAFKTVQTIQVGSYIVGYLTLGIPMSYLGFGVWSLVAAQIMQTMLNAALLYNASRHPIAPLLSRRYGRLVGFSGKVIGSSLVNWTIFNLDTAIAGRCFGVFDLGLYNRAFFSATMPVNGVVIGLQQVLFSGTARVQNEPEKLKRVYLGALAIMSLLTVPMFSAIAVSPTTILTALYGRQWTSAAPFLSAFAVAMPAYATLALAGPFLWGAGRVGSELRAELVVLIAAIGAFTTAYRISLQALAWSVAAIYFLRFVLVTRALLGVLFISWSEILKAMRGSAVLGLFTGVGTLLVDRSLQRLAAGAVSRLCADILMGGTIVVIGLAVQRRALLGDDAEWLLKNFSGNLPAFLRWFSPFFRPAAVVTELSVPTGDSHDR